MKIKALEKSIHWIIALIFGMIMIRTTIPNGHDLTVYYVAAKEAFSPDGIYSLARDGNLVFKYPPWIVPFFFPFSFFSLPIAKGIWGFVQAISLLYSVRVLEQNQNSPWTISVVLLFFAPLWVIHSYAGQVALPMMALCLVFRKVYTENERGWRWIGLVTVLSSKIFSMAPLFGFRFKKKEWPLYFKTILFWGLLTTPFILHSGVELFSDWVNALQSGKPIDGFIGHAGMIDVSPLSRDSQGIPSFILKKFGGNPYSGVLVGTISVSVAVFLSLIWSLSAKKIERHKQWLGWIALIALVHPLSGFYSFVLVFPLSVTALDSVIKSRSPTGIFLCLLGLVALTAITQKTLGGTVGGYLENLCIKSWGVLLIAFVMVWFDSKKVLVQ